MRSGIREVGYPLFCIQLLLLGFNYVLEQSGHAAIPWVWRWSPALLVGFILVSFLIIVVGLVHGLSRMVGCALNSR